MSARDSARLCDHDRIAPLGDMLSRFLSLLRDGLLDLSTRPPRNVPVLDVLRTIAIVLVFSGHFGSEFATGNRLSRLPIFYFGWTGVDLFFVLSGFLIGVQIWKEVKRSGSVRVGRFLLRRGLRIWPLYFGFILLIAAEGLFEGRHCHGLWADATFLSNYFSHQIGGGWSLSTEEQFYILFPILILLVARQWKTGQLILLPIVALILLPASRALTIHFSAAPIDEIRNWMYAPIHTHADGLAAGVLIAWIHVFRPNFMRDPLPRYGLSLLMLLCGTGLYALNRDVFNFSALGLIFGGVTLAGFHAPQALFNWKGFYLISRLSYGIYLNHFGLVPITSDFLLPWQAQGSLYFFAAYGLTFLACTAFAALTFLLIEYPFLRLRERWIHSFQSLSPASVTHPDPHPSATVTQA